MRDIAKHAGVSVATVSRVTRDDPRVTAATRERVQASIDALGYEPSALGQGLAFQRYNTLGIVLPGLGGPYFAELIQGAESVALESGVAVNVLGTHLRPDAGQAVRQLATRTDGLVVEGGTVDDELLRDLAQTLPVVLVADEASDLLTVRTDGRTASHDLTTHLLEVHGHRRLRFVGAPEGSPDTIARYAGFRQALAEHGLDEAGEPVRQGLESKYGAVAAREMHAEGVLPQAIVCANDELAIGMLATLPGLGYSIPHDVAIVGFDDHDIAALASPTLTTVHQPIFELGATAAGLVLATVHARKGVFTPLAPDDRVLETQVVIRESCGCTP
ncbi:LacI family DNA-binding transcriptional regulator [Oerskovia turbata]